MTQVTAIVINYNGGQGVIDCIGSVKHQTIPTHIIVVDNASQDGSDQLLIEKYPEVQLIKNHENLGWGAASNQAIQLATTDYVALINNDAFLDTKCLEKMCDILNANPQCGSVTGKILLKDHPDQIDDCGMIIYKDSTALGRGRKLHKNHFNKIEEIFCSNGCCSLYRKKMFDDIGLYDPDFFIYCEDIDLGWRQQLAGWKSIYTPHAIAYHAYSNSAGAYSGFKLYYIERNRLFICFKYFSTRMLLLSVFYTFYRYLSQFFIAYRYQHGALNKFESSDGLFQGIKILLQAYYDALKKLPLMLKKRKTIKTRVKSKNTDVKYLFQRYKLTAKQIAHYD